MKINLGTENLIQETCNSTTQIEETIDKIIQIQNLPKSKNALILLKPNLNNDLIGLTGNSTDLRIIVALIKALKKRKYTNIVIADGPNCGIDHYGIDVFSRLKLDEIAKIFKTKLINLNKAESKTVKLNNKNIKVAKICLDADFFINLPKIKTHTEAILSISSKNLVGCFTGLEKRKIHTNLHKNIVKINEIIKPNLHIIDGLYTMEGNGPSDGITKKLNLIISGKNPFLLDAYCAKLLNFKLNKVKYLQYAYKNDYLTKENINYLNNIKPITNFKKPYQTLFSKILLRNFFIMPRYWKIFDPFFNKGIIPNTLIKLKIRQDVYIDEEPNAKLTGTFNGLQHICPLKLKTPEDKKCINCFYCYFKNPNKIKAEGELGFLKFQLKKFGGYIIN